MSQTWRCRSSLKSGGTTTVVTPANMQTAPLINIGK
jgi:hypothetical protein